jgi:hypothetical protein
LTEAKHRPPAVHAGAKRLVEILLAKPGIALADAAKEAGIATSTARTHLGKTHVIAYYRAEKRRLLEEISLGNPTALADIRDKADNSMARVAAIRGIEAMRVDALEEGHGVRRHAPGLVVQIVNGSTGELMQRVGPPPAPMIEAVPIEQGDD